MDLTFAVCWRAALVLLLCGPFEFTARAESAESNALRTAVELFQDNNYPLAQKKFAEYLATYTNSPNRSSAILCLARTELAQSNNTAAIDLLEKSFPAAGESLRREYVYWIAQGRLQSGDYRRAAEGFGNIARSPSSPHVLDAAYYEAESYAQIPDWPRTIELLEATNQVFHRAALADPRNKYSIMGTLLLARALQAEHRYAEAEKIARGLDPSGLDPDFRWERLYVLCDLQLAAGQAEQAWKQSTNLLDLAIGAGHLARSQILAGDILRRLGRLPEALQMYARDLTDGAPGEDQRAALAGTVEITETMGSPAAAIQQLETLAAERPQAPGRDILALSLAGLYLQIQANPPRLVEGSNTIVLAQTNYLAGALTNLNMVLQTSTNAELIARAHLDRGWCEWLQDQIQAARTDFAEAASTLPLGEDQAIARIKTADADFYMRYYAEAASNYTMVLERYTGLPSVTNGLFSQALYQIVLSDIALTNLPGAEEATRKILRWYPESYFGPRSMLAVGKEYDYHQYDYEQARKVFNDLLKLDPHSALAPEVEYAIARTHAHEHHWKAAIAGYEQWEKNHPRDPMFPQVEFSLAHALDKSGQATNAFLRFTNFVARYPGNPLWPWAKNWVADYYYNLEDYPDAELNYQQLYHSTNAGDLAWQARLWAGRAALNHNAVEDAIPYFADIINNAPSNTPAGLVAEAQFALSDAIFRQSLNSPANKTNYDQAIYAISKLTNGAPTNATAVEAIGRLGDYYMHWADIVTNAPEAYVKAAQMYRAILAMPASATSVAARSQAEVGLGWIAEKQHHPQEALEHYYDIIDGYDSDHFDRYWVYRAGEFGGRLCEQLEKWDAAVKIYQRVLEADPSLRGALDAKIRADESHAEAARN